MNRTEDNKKLVYAHYDAIWSGDEKAIRNQIAPGFVDHAAPPGTPPGVDAVIAWGRMLRSAVPDMTIAMDHCVAEGDIVACHASWHGTHRGSVHGGAPTGLPVRFSGMVFWRVVDGRIAERWAQIDTAAMLAQIRGKAA